MNNPPMTEIPGGTAAASTVVFLTHDTWSSMFDRRTQVKAEHLADAGVPVYILTASFSRYDIVHQLEKFTVIECGTGPYFKPITPVITDKSFGWNIETELPSWRSYVWLRLKNIQRVLLRKSGRVAIRNLEKLQSPPTKLVEFLYEMTERHFSYRFTKVLNALSFDVVVAEDLNGLISVGYWNEKFVNVCYDAHELFPEQSSLGCLQRSWLARKQKEAIKSVRVLVAINDFHANYFHQLNPDIPITAIISNGLTSQPDAPEIESAFRPLKERWPKEKIWLYHGIINRERGLGNLIQTFKEAELENVRLVIMGFYSEENRSFAETLIEDSSVNISIVPGAPAKDLRHVCRGIDAIVIPYSAVDLNFAYCFPNKLGDALEWRIPILFNSTLLGIKEMADTVGIGVGIDFDSPNLGATQLRAIYQTGFPTSDFNLADKLYGSEAVSAGLEAFTYGVKSLLDQSKP